MADDIDEPVGSIKGIRRVPRPLRNKKSDQLKVLELLNRIPQAQGGLQGKGKIITIDAEGKCPKDLADAIWEFQLHWKKQGVFKNIDGVVDPKMNTFNKMAALAAGSESIVKTTDVVVHIIGARNPAAGGQTVPDDEGQLFVGVSSVRAFNQAVQSRPDYLTFHKPLKHIMIRGLASAARLAEIAAQIEAIGKNEETKPIGGVLLVGLSSGGPNILDLARLLAGKKIPIDYVGVCDAAFSNAQDPRRAMNFTALKTENFFQRRGDAIDPAQEFHGRIEGFQSNVDFTGDLDFQARQQVLEVQLKALPGSAGRTRQEAMDDFHVMAVKKGYTTVRSSLMTRLA